MKWQAMSVLVLLLIVALTAGAQSSPQDTSLAQETQARGYWIDPSTGLMWAGKDNGKDVSWRQATKYCRNLPLAGFSDWRLAGIDELQGIYDKSVRALGRAGMHDDVSTTWHVKGNIFLTGDEWGSAQRSDDRGHPSGYAWYFDFNEGRSNEEPTGFPYSFSFMRALCVRNSGEKPRLDYPKMNVSSDKDLPPGDLFEQAEVYKATAEADPSVAQIYNQKALAIYLSLLKMNGLPEARRAQMELGNFVIDGIYSAGDDPKARALNLEWARIIAQELLGQEELKIAVDYRIGREDLSIDQAMWLRFCKRAAAYNIDLAQHSYAEAINNAAAKDFSGHDAIAWTRLAGEKRSGDLPLLKAFTSFMTAQQIEQANAAYKALADTRKRAGAYYPADDPLRSPSPADLDALPKDDPDAQLRRAFDLEKAAAGDAELYVRVLHIYRTIRNRRKMDIRYALGLYSLDGKFGVPKNREIAEYWLREAANEGSKPAQNRLADLASQPAK